jgi:hypothetical protein
MKEKEFDSQFAEYDYINTAKPKDKGYLGQGLLRHNEYRYDKPSPYLYMFGGLLQRVVAQCGTKMLSGKWMEQPTNYAIFKCEGGCRIEGHGDLVLVNSCCYFDYGYRDTEEKENKLAGLITDIVLNFDPINPQSIIDTAAKHIDVTSEELEKELAKMRSGIFGGNALSDFFNHNPFAESPKFKMQDYEKYVRVHIYKEKEADVQFDLDARNNGRDLLKRMQDAIIEKKGDDNYISMPMCCSPSIDGKKISYWINTGRSTCIDGWKTEKEIQAFINRINREGVEFYLKSDKMSC